MLFSSQSYGSGTDIIDEIQFLSRQRSEIFARKPVLYLAPVDFFTHWNDLTRSAVDNLGCCKK